MSIENNLQDLYDLQSPGTPENTAPPVNGNIEAVVSLSTLTGTDASGTCPDIPRVATINGKPYFQTAVFPQWVCEWDGLQWVVTCTGGMNFMSVSSDDVATPDLAVFEAPTVGSGTPSFSYALEVIGTPATEVGEVYVFGNQVWECTSLSPFTWQELPSVPVDAFIQPPQAYVDSAPFVAAKLLSIGQNSFTGGNFSNLGMTHFSLAGGYEQADYAFPYINSDCTVDVSLNLMPAADVIQFFADARIGIEQAFSSFCYFYAHGPDLGCPLVGGTVGGWTLDLSSYVTGTGDSCNLRAGYYYRLLDFSIALDPELAFSASYATYVAEPEDYFELSDIKIGVQDFPTNAQILAKIEELYLTLNANGTLEIVGDVITYTDTTIRGWFTFLPGTLIVAGGTGADPTNPDIDYLITQSCTGSFTGPDGITQINF